MAMAFQQVTLPPHSALNQGHRGAIEEDVKIERVYREYLDVAELVQGFIPTLAPTTLIFF